MVNQPTQAVVPTNGQTPQSIHLVDTREKDEHKKGDGPEDGAMTWAQRRRAYAATLFMMGTIVHVVASVVTIFLYFLLPQQSTFSLWFGLVTLPVWFAPVCGAISTYFVFLVLAVFCYPYVGTIKGVSTRSYGLVSTRLCQLRARLNAFGLTDDREMPIQQQLSYEQSAQVEAYRCYQKVDLYLRSHRAGLRWVTGMGYFNAWTLMHRAEEALIKIEPKEMVFRGAMHDKLAIQNSTIGKRDELLNKLKRAITDLYPEGAIYFQEELADDDNELLRKIAEAMNKIATTHPHIDIDDVRKKSLPQQNAARMMISEVRRTLNDFRDNLWEGILRERNQLLNTVGITGLVTHILLSITIVMMGVTNTPRDLLMAATAYYMLGAVAGLFARFYNEVNTSNAGDDFGLSLARLIATPLLSGLAGVGGVIISLVLSDTLTPGNTPLTLGSMFKFEPSYLLTAAAFGLAPNLIITGLQQRTAKYSADLQKSKGGAQGTQAN